MLQRVQKILSNAGYCSRRKAEELIKLGQVTVNGQIVNIGSKADPDKDKIVAEGRLVGKSEKLYYAFNKPGDCITTLSDPEHRKTIFSYINLKDRVIPVGRLDFNTEGLLFLTNDGDFANKVMHPRYETEKTYVVWLEKKFSLDDVKKIKEGIELDGEKTEPGKVRFVDEKHFVIEVTIHEGMNRIIRRMMEALGHHVNRLVRTRIGKVELGNLAQGKVRKLSHQEVMQFMKVEPAPRKKENEEQ